MTDRYTYDHFKLVAELQQNQGFLILLDAIQADVDDALDRVRHATTAPEELKAVSEWKALDLVLGRFKNLPLYMQHQAKEVENTIPHEQLHRDQMIDELGLDPAAKAKIFDDILGANPETLNQLSLKAEGLDSVEPNARHYVGNR